MSCQRCNSAINTGRAICLHCGGSTLGAAKFGNYDNNPALSQSAISGSSVQSIGNQDGNASWNSPADYGQNWDTTPTSPKVCRGFIYGIIAIIGTLLIPLAIIVFRDFIYGISAGSIGILLMLPVIIFGDLAIFGGKRGKKANEERASAAIILGAISVVIAFLSFVLLF